MKIGGSLYHIQNKFLVMFSLQSEYQKAKRIAIQVNRAKKQQQNELEIQNRTITS